MIILIDNWMRENLRTTNFYFEVTNFVENVIKLLIRRPLDLYLIKEAILLYQI